MTDAAAELSAPSSRWAHPGLRGAFWGLLAVAVWAGSFVITRMGVKAGLNAFDLVALRFATAGALMVPILRRRGLAFDRLGLGGLVLLVAGSGAPYALMLAAGARYAPASHAAALTPGPMAAMTALLGALFLRERLPVIGWAGVGLILGGSALIGGPSLFSGSGEGAALGHALFLGGALVWAIYVIVLRRSGVGPLHATAIVATGSALLYLPLYLLVLPKGVGQAAMPDIALQAIYQGCFTTLVGLAAFNRAVVLLGATGAAALPALIPVVTLGLGALMLGEAPSLAETAATLLIGGGVLVTTLARNRRPPPSKT
ncbi:threonine/homoserine efflux transporter RhtA [Nitrospirillum amazonense]|uniref:Threonine/homoserine efflux transporter RhtA n=1 Tax=Nitrospirillum amazonense TaxID=28077 RepID=A0A560JVW6_9PROT|nr:DMT family transporter [Nitrospirillum amazonense]TWB75255.1 threonine/homoserine efflux transporter RhtA [Nitrospirillum amazonense]